MSKGTGARSEWIGTVTASVGGTGEEWQRSWHVMCDRWSGQPFVDSMRVLTGKRVCAHFVLCSAQCTMAVVTIFKLHTANDLENGCARKHIQTISGFASQILLNCLKEKEEEEKKKRKKKMQENTETGGCLFHSPLSCAWSVYAARIAIYFVCYLA